MNFFTWFLYALSALVLINVAGAIRTRIHNKVAARSLGCLPPPTARNRGWGGLKTLLESIKATRDEWGPIWLHQAINEVGVAVHTIRAVVLDYELLITRDPENVKAMFASQAEDFDIGKHRQKTFKSLLGHGVMTNRGQAWKHSRALVRGQFARYNVADMSLLDTHTDALLKRLGTEIDPQTGWTGKLDVAPLFYALTLDISTEFLLGTSTSVLDPEARSKTPLGLVDGHEPDLEGFGRHLDGAKKMLDRRGALAKYGWLLRDKRYPMHCKKVQDFVDYFVHLRLERMGDAEKSVGNVNGKEKFILLDHLATETTHPLHLRNELLNVLHASRDTTAALMGWVFYFLARHGRVFDRLREDVLERFGQQGEKELTFESLHSMGYMQCVINETIRSVGIVPINERMAMRDTTLPRGGGLDGQSPIFVPKGQQVLIPTYSMQHREDIWGSDVDEFRPERFENRKSSWSFIPFGGGSRQCLGQQFARTEASYLLVRLLQRFDKIENMEKGDGKLKMHHTIENRSGTGVQVRFRVAENYR
ncbi:uncharacterized protein HMPREF1541_09107 [Cyphellophora europaea CBS 101466]|uniref:Cytochrome P450 n=1 Tax=Cyphellophora europaea (strain CBS 101466) TaxID=1220924 RepID=W2S969_CYPE1|nr:uncharacterized protein HMPREF1541_09107 [Cyphellophora europaea CBS 101466]ETN45276.1 hypothetical protein HMPREF1541_09107 [Cyphellophora europaea CBS 101466]